MEVTASRNTEAGPHHKFMLVCRLYEGITNTRALMHWCLEVSRCPTRLAGRNITEQTLSTLQTDTVLLHFISLHRETLLGLGIEQCLDKYSARVNKHASQSQVEDILRLTATSDVANTDRFNRVTVFSYNIAVDLLVMKMLFAFVHGYLTKPLLCDDIIRSSQQRLYMRAYCIQSMCMYTRVCLCICGVCSFVCWSPADIS